MVKTKEELIADVQAVLGENKSDEGLTLIENISDTFDAAPADDNGEDWETKYNDLYQKYVDRFLGKNKEEEENNEEEENSEESEEPESYEDLFTETKEEE